MLNRIRISRFRVQQNNSDATPSLTELKATCIQSEFNRSEASDISENLWNCHKLDRCSVYINAVYGSLSTNELAARCPHISNIQAAGIA